MLSVIVYGRNDSNGYNYHKRVSLSINNIAESIGTQDEIVFVDYNTPDDSPTLLESIADTLTPAAKQQTRVIRVRNKIHRRFASEGSSNVIESIARNVGLRRSNPSNRWILFTNTDVLLVPRQKASLSEVLAALPSGHYGLPRFEIPESVWDEFDRLAPDGVASQLRELGLGLRLNEVVYGVKDVLFDGPGDFQLVERSVLFTIDGCNEQMTRAWHVDHNLEKRLGLTLGDRQSILDRFFLYHCSHGRVPTAVHRSSTANDAARFVDTVTTAGIVEQKDQWGCPDDDLEEIRLERVLPYRTVLSSIMPPLNKPYLEAHYNEKGFDNFWYDSGHVAAYLLGFLRTLAPSSVIALIGCRRDLAHLLLKGLEGLGFENRVLIPESLAVRLDMLDVPQCQLVPEEAIFDAADVFIFEFGLIRDETGRNRPSNRTAELHPEERRVLEEVQRVLARLHTLEKRASFLGLPQRLVCVANSVHNQFEPAIAEKLVSPPIPFTTRLRWGRLGGDAPALTQAAESMTRDLMRRAGRTRPFSAQQIMGALWLIEHGLTGDAPDANHVLAVRAAAPLIGGLLDAFGATGDLAFEQAETVRRNLDACMSWPAHPNLTVVSEHAGPGRRSASTLASIGDWEDLDWANSLSQVLRSDERSRNRHKHGWLWERAQTLHALRRLGRSQPARGLVVGGLPDRIVGALSSVSEALDVVDIRSFFGERPSGYNKREWTQDFIAQNDRITLVEPADLQTGSYEFAVIPHSAGLRFGIAGLAYMLEKIEPLLAKDAVVIVSGEAPLEPSAELVDLASIAALAKSVGSQTGFSLPGGFDAVVSNVDAGLFGSPEQQHKGEMVLGVVREGIVRWPFVLAFIRRLNTKPGAWQAVAQSGVAPFLGNQLGRLLVGPVGQRSESGLISAKQGDNGFVFFGPYIYLPPGTYSARLVFGPVRISAAAKVSRVVTEVVAGDQRYGEDVFDGVEGYHHFRIPVVVRERPSGERPRAPIEIRMWSFGTASFPVTSVEIVREGDAPADAEPQAATPSARPADGTIAAAVPKASTEAVPSVSSALVGPNVPKRQPRIFSPGARRPPASPAQANVDSTAPAPMSVPKTITIGRVPSPAESEQPPPAKTASSPEVPPPPAPASTNDRPVEKKPRKRTARPSKRR